MHKMLGNSKLWRLQDLELLSYNIDVNEAVQGFSARFLEAVVKEGDKGGKATYLYSLATCKWLTSA